MKFSNLISKNNLVFILPILSGFLLILAYPPYDLEFLAWITLIPLFYFLSLKSISTKKALIGGIITGIIFFGKLFSWLFATAPFEWLGITTEKGFVFVFILLTILYIVQTIFLGLFIGIFSWITKKLIPLNGAGFRFLIIIPALWIIFEYLRSWGFGILYLGKESLLGPHWTFGNLAYALHNNSTLIQFADIGGIYGVSFLIVLVNTALFLILTSFLKLRGLKLLEKKQILVGLLIIILIGTTWTGYGIYKLNIEEKGEQRKIALLQTNFLSGSEFNPYQKKQVFKTVVDLFKSGGEADFIIAPEGFGLVSLSGDKEIAKYLLKDFWQPEQVFLENQKIIDENQKPKSRLFYFDLEREAPIAFHDKMLLVPNGDFLPYLTKILLSIYSFDIEHEQRLYQRGEEVNVAQTQKGNIGGTICSSILSPGLQRGMTKNNAQFLIVVSSDAPFHGSNTLLAQNLAMSKLRAIENRRYFAQATNMGYSFLLNPKGQVIAKSSQLGNEILFSDIQLLNKKTIYTKFGDWIIILAILILFLVAFKRVVHRIYFS